MYYLSDLDVIVLTHFHNLSMDLASCVLSARSRNKIMYHYTNVSLCIGLPSTMCTHIFSNVLEISFSEK
jgi:hypothetical protein